MRFSIITAAFLAPLCAQAMVAFTNNAYNGITAGVPFTLSWSGDGTPVSIELLNGPKEMLVKVDTVTNSAIGPTYSWTPSKALTAGTYVLSIAQSGSTNYSPQFLIANNKSAAPSPTPTPRPAATVAAVSRSAGGLSVPLTIPSSISGKHEPDSVHHGSPPVATRSLVSSLKPLYLDIAINGSNSVTYSSLSGTLLLSGPSALVIGTTGSSVKAHPVTYAGIATGAASATPVPSSRFEGGASRTVKKGLGLLVAPLLLGTALRRLAF